MDASRFMTLIHDFHSLKRYIKCDFGCLRIRMQILGYFIRDFCASLRIIVAMYKSGVFYSLYPFYTLTKCLWVK